MTEKALPVRVDIQDDVATITIDAPPVNALSAEVRAGLLDALAAVAASPASAAVLCCAGRTFIAGADIKEFESGPAHPDMHALTEAVEAFPKPIVAAMHGAALGGGLEVALCCNFRIAARSTRFGFPEVGLGILAAAGGTQRLTRLVGPRLALHMTALAEQIGAQQALDAGLIDAVVEDGQDLQTAALRFITTVLAERRGQPRARDRMDKLNLGGQSLALFADFRKAHVARFRGLRAPEANIKAVEAAINLRFEDGLMLERSLLGELFASGQPAALSYVFFSERAATKVSDITPDTQRIPIRKVGVIGAGTMGGGIAMCFVNAGIPVVLVDIQARALEAGLNTIRSNYEWSVRSGRFTLADIEQRMAAISPATTIAAVADCDLVIEATFEDMNVKRAVFAEFDRTCAAGAVLATNTSGLNIDEIAAVTSRPQAVIGLHFASPANITRGVEIVRGRHTSREVVATALEVSKRIGKLPIVVRVGPGFVANRTMYPQRGAAEALLAEGALPWDIDKALVDFGFPMGPFAMQDLAGLDVGWDASRSRGETLRDLFCEAGRRGQKVGAGYYDYGPGRQARPAPAAEEIIRRFLQRSGHPQRSPSAAEILQRTLLPIVNEGAKVLQEGIAQRGSDIDVCWRLGFGWPAYRGGPMYYADQIGLDQVIEGLKANHQEPAALLLETARSAGRLHAIDQATLKSPLRNG